MAFITGVRRLGLLLPALALLTGGCFTELTKDRCQVNEDCFEGELCNSGFCTPFTVVGTDTQAETSAKTVTITAKVFSTDDPTTPSTTLASYITGPGGCNCQAGKDGCTYSVKVGETVVLCGSLPNHQQCKVEQSFSASGPTEVELHLTACSAGTPYCGTSDCDCSVLPTCSP